MTRFHPLGRRAVDGGNPDGRYCQIPVDEYMAHSNSERLLIFQIESPEALENVEAIAAVPGYEMLLFGPGDFSHLIGKPGPNQRAGGGGGAQTGGGGCAESTASIADGPRHDGAASGARSGGLPVFTLGADVLVWAILRPASFEAGSKARS